MVKQQRQIDQRGQEVKNFFTTVTAELLKINQTIAGLSSAASAGNSGPSLSAESTKFLNSVKVDIADLWEHHEGFKADAKKSHKTLADFAGSKIEEIDDRCK